MSCDLSESDPLLDERTRALFEESQEIFRRVKSRTIILPLQALGSLYWRQGKYAASAEYFDEALAAAQKHADSVAVIRSLCWLGYLALSQGNYSNAAEFFGKRATINQKRGTNVDIVWTQFYLGTLAWETGKLDQAYQIFVEVLESAQDHGILDLEVQALVHIGKVYLERGDCPAAKNSLRKALVKRQGNNPIFGWEIIEAIAFLTVCPQANSTIPQLEWSARLLGATEDLHQKWQLTRMPRERKERESAIVTVRQALGGATFSTAWEEGKAMTLEQAIAYAKEIGDG